MEEPGARRTPSPAAARPAEAAAGAGRVRRQDWRPPDWLVERARLDVALDPVATRVSARLVARRHGRHQRPLVLDGGALVTRAVRLDGRPVPPPPPGAPVLCLAPEGETAVVETEVELAPAANRQLYGLHLVRDILVSQCEAEGFRRITWFPDRPDIRTRFRVRLEADRARFPVLLSNGIPGAAGDLPGGRHFAEWEDPLPKPCYLFGLVAGDLESIETRLAGAAGGRDVLLRLWAPPGEARRGRHALETLARVIAFDRAAFGRRPDLPLFQLVAVPDFAFGAMENRGLYVFNARHLLADAETATDRELLQVAAVVAHEHLHNWSGNRVAIRDWFQLALKEGLTVWRERCFMQEELAPAVARLRQVEALEGAEAGEEAGGSVRPESAGRVEQFYTAALYDRGAELIGMMARTLGEERMRAAVAAFLDRFDGRPVTVEDFLQLLGEFGLDAARFARWYETPGPVRLSVRLRHGGADEGVALSLAQQSPAAGRGARPLPLPLDLALFRPDGRLAAGPLLHLMTETSETLLFPEVRGPVAASVNRGLSAAVAVEAGEDRAVLALLARAETDAVARRRALWALFARAVAADLQGEGAGEERAGLIEALSAILARAPDEPELAAELLRLPPEPRLLAALPRPDPGAAGGARDRLAAALACALRVPLREVHAACAGAEAVPGARGRGLRALANVSLALRLEAAEPEAARAALRQLEEARTMTLRMGALEALVHTHFPERDRALALFRDRFGHLPGAAERWLAVQAASRRADAVEQVAALAAGAWHDRTDIARVQALFRSFGQNPRALFRADGAGLRLLLAEAEAVDVSHPMLAAGLLRPLGGWRRLAPRIARMVQRALARLARRPRLSAELSDMAEALLA